MNLSLPLRLVIAFPTGAALVAAFAPFNFWLLALICPLILLALWHNLSGKAAFWVGYAFGAGFFGIGVNWVYNSIHEFGHSPAVFAITLTIVFALFLALFPAIVGWLQAKRNAAPDSVDISPGTRYLLLIPAAWVFIEWVRGWIFTGFPWLQLGYSQIDTPLAALAPITGVLGSSWVLMLLSGLIMYAVMVSGWRRLIAVIALPVIVMGNSFLLKMEWTEPYENSLSVAIIQGNIAQENKWSSDWLIPTIRRYLDLTEENLDADLIVWPEVALPGGYDTFKTPVFDPLIPVLEDSKTDLITGILYFVTDDEVYNSLLNLRHPDQIYFKRHLVPFGEYLPFRDIFARLNLDGVVQLPAGDITPGKTANLIPAGEYLIASSICYEDAYGEEMRPMLPQASLLVNASNDAWFGDSLAPPQHLQIARMRALESGRYLLRATNTGISAVMDHKGRITDSAPQFKTHVIKTTVTPRKGETPYIRWGNRYWVGLMLIIVLIIQWQAYRQRKNLSHSS